MLVALRHLDPVVLVTQDGEEQKRVTIGFPTGAIPRRGDKYLLGGKLYSINDIVWHGDVPMEWQPVATMSLGEVVSEDENGAS